MAGEKFDSKSFNPQAFGKYVERIPQLKKNELVKSGALKGNIEIRNAFSSQTGTAYAVLPMYGLLDGDVLNYDGVTDIEATSTTTYERGVVVIGRAKAWTEGDFAVDITGGVNFMDNVAAQVAEYFDEVDQSTLLAILEGIFSMTGEQDAEFIEKHTYDITAIDDGLMTPTTLNSAISRAAGDNKNKFTMSIMHSAVATNLENLNLLEYLKQTDSNGIQRELGLGTWNGRTVIIDDDMPYDSDTGAYTTYVLGAGAFDYENIGAKVPYEMDRDPAKNGGRDTLYARQRKCYAPYGISYTKQIQATLSPTEDELASGDNWTLVNDGNGKVINHRAIPIARIISKG
ncbi:MAG: phage coat protein [Clostridiales bacterium]|nr:phage coat protein [Clostridiales bacterium]